MVDPFGSSQAKAPAPYSATFAIDGWFYVFQRVGNTGEGFGMPDEEIASGFQAFGQPAHDSLLRRPVEVNHHVAAKDHRELPGPRERLHEVDTEVIDRRAQGFNHRVGGWIAFDPEIAC